MRRIRSGKAVAATGLFVCRRYFWGTAFQHNLNRKIDAVSKIRTFLKHVRQNDEVNKKMFVDLSNFLYFSFYFYVSMYIAQIVMTA